MSNKFKIGDRVLFSAPHDENTDTGTITRPADGNDVWWAKWDSDGCESFSHEKHLTLISVPVVDTIPEPTHTMTLLKAAALSALEEGNCNLAMDVLKLLIQYR